MTVATFVLGILSGLLTGVVATAIISNKKIDSLAIQYDKLLHSTFIYAYKMGRLEARQRDVDPEEVYQSIFNHAA